MPVRTDDFVKAQIALTAWRYASHYGSHTPQVLVAQVIANRFRRGWGQWLELVERMPKYQSAPPAKTGYPDLWDKSFLRVLNEMDTIYDGTSKDTVNGAVYFGDTTDIQNEWFLEKICRSGEYNRVHEMGTLVFWGDPPKQMTGTWA